jgi:hypothetical protein
MSRRKYDPEKIVEWILQRRDWEKSEYTPTEIGMEVFNLPYATASGAMCPILSKLCLSGRIERGTKSGTYRAKGSAE